MGTTSARADGKPLVLVVDDDEALRDSLAVALERYGYRTSCAADGVEAIHVVEAEPSDVIVLDLFMPNMDGFEVMAQLREMHLHIPIIVVSGGDHRGDQAILRRAHELGADASLRKPFDIDDLARLLSSVAPALGRQP